MHRVLKTSTLVISIAVLFAMPSGKAGASSHWYCSQQYQDCIAAGVDYWTCEAEYYACRGMQIPVKAPATTGNTIGKD